LYDVLKPQVLSPNQLERYGFPTVANLEKGRQQVRNRNKNCHKCKKDFRVDENGLQIAKENCTHHVKKVTGYYRSPTDGRHPCCNGKYGSVGCKTTPHHVFEEFDPENFVRTKAWPKIEKVFAIDCEMVHTTKGMEAAKVCVIDDNGNMIYESLIKPEKMVTNYNTEFSGIAEKDLNPIKTRIEDVQKVLLSLFSEDTILVGHGLDNDMKYLKLIHNKIVDTCAIFTHPKGLPFKKALRTLANDKLNRTIQTGNGHDPKEDAEAVLDLLKMQFLRRR